MIPWKNSETKYPQTIFLPATKFPLSLQSRRSLPFCSNFVSLFCLYAQSTPQTDIVKYFDKLITNHKIQTNIKCKSVLAKLKAEGGNKHGLLGMKIYDFPLVINRESFPKRIIIAPSMKHKRLEVCFRFYFRCNRNYRKKPKTRNCYNDR